MQKQAKITTKGRITIPCEIRQLLGVRPGDWMLFESSDRGVRVRALKPGSPFSKYRGIGNPGIRFGGKVIKKWMREVRGE